MSNLGKWETLDIKTLVASAEIVFTDQHYCNNNLKQKIETHDEDGFDENGKPVF